MKVNLITQQKKLKRIRKLSSDQLESSLSSLTLSLFLFAPYDVKIILYQTQLNARSQKFIFTVQTLTVHVVHSMEQVEANFCLDVRTVPID
jgi:hypothetical protein